MDAATKIGTAGGILIGGLITARYGWRGLFITGAATEVGSSGAPACRKMKSGRPYLLARSTACRR